MSQPQMASPEEDSQQGAGEVLKAPKSKPTKPLPTARIAFTKQLDVLRAYAAISGQSAKPATNKEVGDIMKMVETTVSMGNAFFCAIGLLQRTDAGFVPSSEVMNYSRAYAWKPEGAAHQLSPAIRAAWFSEALLPKLGFGPLEEDDALARLAQTAAAGPEYRNQLKVCLEYMEAAGIITRDGTILRLNKDSALPKAAETVDTAPTPEPGQTKPGSVATGFTQSANLFQFHIDINVDLNELREWKPERIAALFAGIAQVISAKGGLEQNTAR